VRWAEKNQNTPDDILQFQYYLLRIISQKKSVNDKVKGLQTLLHYCNYYKAAHDG